MEITAVITFFATSIIPIISGLISILTYINNRKKKKIERELNQKNINGNNYYYEDNRSIELYSTNNYLVAEQERLTIKQQNINNISKFFSKYSYIFLLILLIINFWNLITPLPAYPWISTGSNQENLIGFLFSSLYRALIPTMITMLFLIGLLCFMLLIKNILLFKNKYTIVCSLIYYPITIYAYYLSSKTIANVPLEKINLSSNVSQKLNLSTFFNTELPFIILLLITVIFGIIIKLIQILFEFESNKPNLKLLNIFFPRFGFFIALFLLPFFIILGAQYI
ncbi:hypothetical protein BH747_06185 [Enterococcus villorum]|uniref:Uncharacterized protein n=1 Tax=Enterococcus villorum TaxID=112904 RepID=A0A1V8YGQ1_9ENTE|nr:hypothetical protein [Enterococcus villorum]OQO70604.1 hypothetical protein BH747_06185 [Enterococcus villorum]OQO71780.1 hypothetical protein BH744_13460 [Enterococcus villorum]